MTRSRDAGLASPSLRNASKKARRFIRQELGEPDTGCTRVLPSIATDRDYDDDFDPPDAPPPGWGRS